MTTDFHTTLNNSNSDQNTRAAHSILAKVFKDTYLGSEKSPTYWDKQGSDFYMLKKDGKISHNDFKFRGKKWGNDLVLELDEPNGKTGWLLDTKKITNYLVWYWADTRQYMVVNYPKLQAIAIEHQDSWRSSCFDAGGTTSGYGHTPGLVVKYAQIPGLKRISKTGELPVDLSIENRGPNSFDMQDYINGPVYSIKNGIVTLKNRQLYNYKRTTNGNRETYLIREKDNLVSILLIIDTQVVAVSYLTTHGQTTDWLVNVSDETMKQNESLFLI